ncbi:alkaline phosphatase family protein [soil metagenome]
MKRNTLLLCFYFIMQSSCLLASRPQVTVIMVVDQFAAHYFSKLGCFFKHGIKELLDNGLVYQNANYPHAMPSTGPGHAALSTGCYPKDHGIVGNNWCTPQGVSVACDDDDPCKAAVINPITGRCYGNGKGPGNIMVDSISDQFMMANQPESPRAVFSVSLKSRSAICTSNRMGKAIWLDGKTGHFTSSKAYFNQLPRWLKQFNQQHNLGSLSKVQWPLFYDRNSPEYDFKNIDNYSFAQRASIVGTTVSIDHHDKYPFALFDMTPAANQLIFDLATHCIQTQLQQNPCQELLIWVCLSSLDIVGHTYGPQSREAIDMIYHLDYQIQQFMNKLGTLLNSTDILFGLTADHGVSPIPELLEQEGFPTALRINYADLIPALNRTIKNKFDIDALVDNCMSAQLYIKEKKWNSLTTEQQTESISLLKNILQNHRGIKQVWTVQELQERSFPTDAIEFFYKNQIYPGRTGTLIVQPFPYCVIDNHNLGTGHRTPYESDTHVPLILYQKNSFKPQHINQTVWTLQLAPTLANLIGIQKPSACIMPLLPGIYEPVAILPKKPITKKETHEETPTHSTPLPLFRRKSPSRMPIMQCSSLPCQSE